MQQKQENSLTLETLKNTWRLKWFYLGLQKKDAIALINELAVIIK